MPDSRNQLNIRISPTLDKAIKLAAMREEMTVTQYVIKTLREAIPSDIMREADRRRLNQPVDQLFDLESYGAR